MEKTCSVSITRDKVTEDWFCNLMGIGGGVVLYEGRNANAAHDTHDDVAAILGAGDDPKAGYTRLKDEAGEINWVTTLNNGGKTACLMQFGKGGANKAADFAEQVNKVLGVEA